MAAQKRIALSTKPQKADIAPNPDQWVERRTAEGTKRLTLDLPASLHARIKVACALKGVPMKDDIIELLEERYPG